MITATRILTFVLILSTLSSFTGCYSARAQFQTEDADLFIGYSPDYTVVFTPLNIDGRRTATYTVRGMPPSGKTHYGIMEPRRVYVANVQVPDALREDLGSDSQAHFTLNIENLSTEQQIEFVRFEPIVRDTTSVQPSPKWPPDGWSTAEKGRVWSEFFELPGSRDPGKWSYRRDASTGIDEYLELFSSFDTYRFTLSFEGPDAINLARYGDIFLMIRSGFHK